MRRRAASLITATLFAAALAGCSHGNPIWGDPEAAPTSAAATAEAAAAPEATATPRSTKAQAAGAWKPCGKDCADVADDTCDGLYAARANSRGALLDMMIQDDFQIDQNRIKDCPRFAADWKVALAGFGEGTLQVGADVQPGKYVTTANLSGKKVLECFWERRDAAGELLGGDTIASAAKVTVTIKAGDATFTSQGCGNWIPA
ncbi:hypothetical protein [Symbioplanes lichenis]|uniref:hypothetical protein n=1 Tax=Symbioplanes lichenis TaxID=1629072 RepID=UPI002738ADC2|nr:hypothetical protein [Actinoplanes lichenis]